MNAENNNDKALGVPWGMQIAAAWAWRLIVIGVAVAALIWLISQISVLVVPLLIAILLASLLQPIVNKATAVGMPRGLGVAATLIMLLCAVGGLVWLIITQFSKGFSDLRVKAQNLWADVLAYLDASPLNVDVHHLEISMTQVWRTVEQHQARIWTGALDVASGTANFFAGALLAFFALIFLLLDGRRIWFWVLGFFPAKAHAAVDTAARAGWVSVGQYARVQIFVAFVDAVGIALGALILQLPLVVPIGIMVFLGSFIPFLGAIVTGAIAALIALVYNGPTAAFIMIGIVLLVQQIESNILQPLIMGNAVRVHPLGVVLAVSMGALVAGVPGALFAVPIAASANSIVNTLAAGKWRGLPDPLEQYRQQQQNREKAKARLQGIKQLRAGIKFKGKDEK